MAEVRNVVSPYFSQSEHRLGKQPAREANGGAGKRSWRKRTPLVTEGIGVERKQHHSTGNRADFRLVSDHENDRRTSIKGEGK